MADPSTCRHTERDRGACRACGRVFADPKPTLVRVAWRDERAQERETLIDAANEFRGILAGFLDVIAIVTVCGRERARSAEKRVRAAEADAREAWQAWVGARADAAMALRALDAAADRAVVAEARLATVRAMVDGTAPVTRAGIRAVLG